MLLVRILCLGLLGLERYSVDNSSLLYLVSVPAYLNASHKLGILTKFC